MESESGYNRSLYLNANIIWLSDIRGFTIHIKGGFTIAPKKENRLNGKDTKSFLRKKQKFNTGAFARHQKPLCTYLSCDWIGANFPQKSQNELIQIGFKI